MHLTSAELIGSELKSQVVVKKTGKDDVPGLTGFNLSRLVSNLSFRFVFFLKKENKQEKTTSQGSPFSTSVVPWFFLMPRP